MEVVKTRTNTKILTREGLVSELTNMASSAIGPWRKNNSVNFVSIIMLAMHIVETYSSTVAKVSSSDKLEAVKNMLPVVVNLCVDQHILSQQQGDALKQKLEIGSDIVVNVIEGLIAVSKNPAFIQAKEEVEKEAKKCWAHCKKHKPVVVHPPLSSTPASSSVSSPSN